MRYLIIFLLAAGLAFPQWPIMRVIRRSAAAPSGPTFVNGGGDYSGGGAYTTTWSPTNGNTLIVWTLANDRTQTHTCSDGEGTGNTYTPDDPAGGAILAGGAISLVGRLFHAANVSGSGAYTITCTGATPAVAVIEISGNRSLDTVSAGANPSASASLSSPSTPTAFTPTTAATALIDGFGSVTGTTITLGQVGAGYTTNSSCQDGSSCFGGAMGYRIVSSSASYSDGWTWTGTDQGQVAINAAYK